MDNQKQDDQAKQTSGIFSALAPEVAADETTTPKLDPAQEREVLMQRARLMGIEFSNNIGTDTLRQRINAKLDDEPEAPPEEAPVAETNALTGEASDAPKKSLRQEIYEEQMRLVRLRITCLDPKKKDLQGEIFTIANEYLGTVRKFVPFGEVTEDGFHVPYCIYTMMKERRFLNIRTVKDNRTGSIRTETSDALEFALEVLPPLTEAELKNLALAQAAAGSVD